MSLEVGIWAQRWEYKHLDWDLGLEAGKWTLDWLQFVSRLRFGIQGGGGRMREEKEKFGMVRRLEFKSLGWDLGL